MSSVPRSRSDLANPSHEGKQKMRWIGKAAGILAVTAALATASAPSMAQTKVTISQAFQSMLYLPFYVAIDKGFFKKEGIDVDKDTAGSPTAALSAVLSGSAQFSLHGPEWTAIAAPQGADADIKIGRATCRERMG